MAYHDELLAHGNLLLNLPSASQADLRRAVSAAYYSLFHLLISETVSHWDLDSSRAGLARMFEHSLMRKVSRRTATPKESPFTGQDVDVVRRLRQVAQAIVILQDKRHIADYDNQTLWSHSQATEEFDRAAEAFLTWQSIRHEEIAQDYLVSLLIKTRD